MLQESHDQLQLCVASPGVYYKTIFKVENVHTLINCMLKARKGSQAHYSYRRIAFDVSQHLASMHLECRMFPKNPQERQFYDDALRILQLWPLLHLQARVRGFITRARIIPAMLSADPADLRQAVLFCVNGCK